MLKIVRSVEWRAVEYPITIAELKSVSRDLDRLLSEKERTGLIDFLAFNPEIGDVIPGTGGVRKVRWPCASKGNGAGLRIIYYFRDLNMPLYVLAVYSKGETLRLTVREEREMSMLVKILVKDYAERNRKIFDAQG